MLVYNLTTNVYMNNEKHWYNNEQEFFIVAEAREMFQIQTHFHFDPSTIFECVNLDENIRFESYHGYDFISLIYFTFNGRNMVFHEINLYIGQNYLYLVLPSDESVKGSFLNYLLSAQNPPLLEGAITILYYRIFYKILNDLFDVMEKFEDVIHEMENAIVSDNKKVYLPDIIALKDAAYHMKKRLSPLLYIGDQFTVNENNFIPEEKMKFFKSIDVRMNKLYDFSVAINEMTKQLPLLYDSKINLQTNELVTKLTVLTVFIGPLTVITGIYGMNFENMPELHYRYAYFIVLGIIATIVISLFIMAKRKKWL